MLTSEMAGGRALRRVLRGAAVPEAALRSPNHRIPLARMVEVFDAAAREVGEEDFGLRVGRQMSLSEYGDWAAYCAGARTLGEGLRRVCKAIWVHEAGSRMWLSWEAGHVVWRYTTGLAASSGVRAFSDHLLKPMLDFPRAFVGMSWQPDWIEMDYARPRDTTAHAALLDGPVHFERHSVGVPIRRADLSARSRLPGLMPRPITSIDLERHRLRRKEDPLEHMIELVDLCLLDGAPGLENVARLIDVGPRTLQRRLARHGSGYRALLEGARRRRSASLLLETDRPVKVIAADLGYREAENFTRAFRTWYGIGPSAYRAAAQAPRG